MNKMARIAWAAVFLAVPCAHAGPAEDALARTAELQKTLQAQQERMTRFESQLQSQGMIGLLNQVEALKAEVARLRGFQEEQAYQMDVAEKRVKDLFMDLDTRLGQVKELASRPMPTQEDAVRLQPAQTLASVPAAAPPAADADAESRAYGAAHGLVKGGKYKEAVQAMRAFLENWCQRALDSGIRQMQSLAQTLRAHATGILNYFHHPISSGRMEGINNKIGAMTRAAYGYRDEEFLFLKLYSLHESSLRFPGV